MTSIYGRLGFNFTPSNTAILEISADAKSQLNSMPRMLQDWQKTDIGNSDIGGYFKNPVANSCASLIVNTSIIFAAANNDPANTWTNSAEAINLANTANNFLIELSSFVSHTNNLSGVNSITNPNNANGAIEFPYYETATGYGRIMIFITHESDGVLNSSPVIGSMTSIFIDTELQANSQIIFNDLQTINNSFVGGIYTISGPAINTIISHIQTANNFIVTRKSSDITFYNNVRSVINDYNEVTRFNDMGEVSRNIVIDYIGTDKIVTRLNSETSNTEIFPN
jgi:hypothetical protein